MRKMIITGGPGVGKTTTLSQLSDRGYTTVPEAARELISCEQHKARVDPLYSPILPWTNLAGFESLVAKVQLKAERSLTSTGSRCDIAFLDRGLGDILAYATLGGISLDSKTLDCVLNAGYETVFFLDQLPQYVNDAQRKETPQEAVRIHEAIYEAYDRMGCHIVGVPVLPPKERAQYIEQATATHYRECELKISVSGHQDLLAVLQTNAMHAEGKRLERNTVYNVLGALSHAGWMVRLRDNGETFLTVKGPRDGADVSQGFEAEWRIPRPAYHMLKGLLSPFVHSRYEKSRDSYHPIGDSNVHICLDEIPSLGQFVEVEAQSPEQVLRWKRRLGIQGDPVHASYSRLIMQGGVQVG